MRALTCLTALAVSMLLSQPALAQSGKVTCESKQADITRDLEHAKAKGQTSRVRGLEKALRETKANCSDAKLEQEQASRLARQEKKVAERARDLKEAQAKGKPSKIAEREAKLAEEKAVLESLRHGAR